MKLQCVPDSSNHSLDSIGNALSVARCLGVWLVTVLLAFLFCCLVTGCQSPVPSTQIRWGKFSLDAPKNHQLEGLDVSIAENGTVRIKIDKHHAQTDPNVVQQAYSGQADVINATGTMAKDLFKAGMEAGAKSVAP